MKSEIDEQLEKAFIKKEDACKIFAEYMKSKGAIVLPKVNAGETDYKNRLFVLCRKFIDDHQICCGEGVWQQDQVNTDALAFIEKICEEIGYWKE